MSRQRRKSHLEPVPAAESPSGPGADAAGPTPPRDPRPVVDAVLDALFAAVYVGIAAGVAHSSDGRFEAASYLLAAVMLAAAAGTAMRRPVGWRVAVAGLVILLLAAFGLLLLLVSSAA